MSILFEPVKIGNFECRNRFVRSATGCGLADIDGYPNQRNIDLMKLLAEGEVGLIVAGFAYVMKSGQECMDEDGIQTDDHIPAYRKMTDAVHQAGGRIALQIAHGGMISMGAEQPVMTVAEDIPEQAGRKLREMDDAEIEEIIDAFGQAARRVEEAGFDGVQIHGSHAHLLSQALSPITNRRTDKWGGSPENRMRFLVEATRAVKKAVSQDYPVLIKLACMDDAKDREGMTAEEGADVARVLEEEGICWTEVSTGYPMSACTPMGVSKPEKEAAFLPLVRTVREKTSGMLGLVGGLRTPSMIEEAMQACGAETVSLCRPLIREPDLIKRWKAGDTRPAECISCGRCVNPAADGNGMDIYCSQLVREAKRREADGG